MFGWILIIAAIAVIAFFLLKGKASSGPVGKGAKSAAKKAVKQPNNPYAGSEFIADAYACDAAKAIDRKRFLADEVPKVPLGNCCDPALCRCKYRAIKDRRIGDDRRHIVGALSNEMPIGDERSNRRAGRDRRKEDISFDYDR